MYEHIAVQEFVTVLMLRQIKTLTAESCFPKLDKLSSCMFPVKSFLTSCKSLIHKTHWAVIRILHYRPWSQHQRTAVTHETRTTLTFSQFKCGNKWKHAVNELFTSSWFTALHFTHRFNGNYVWKAFQQKLERLLSMVKVCYAD